MLGFRPVQLLGSLPSSDMGFGVTEDDTYRDNSKASLNLGVDLLNGFDLYKESIGKR